MRRALVLALVSLTLPMAAWANGIDLFNKFGTITISNAGITSKGSQLNQFNGINTGHSLGSVSFGTGALLSGSIQAGGTFSSVGSFFKVVGTGQAKGMIFNGAFVGPITWTLVSQSGPSLIFELSGALSGVLHNGHISAYGDIGNVRREMQMLESNRVAGQDYAEQESERVAQQMIAVISA